MSNKKLQSILKDAMEEEIAASEVDLWEAVKTNLAVGTHQQGDVMNIQKSRRYPRFAAAIALAALVAAFLLATPQGRTFAQTVLSLFTPADSTTFPLENPPGPVAETEENAPTALPPSPLISVTEAEAQVGFEIAELPVVPAGFEYIGVRLYGRFVSVEFNALGGGGHLAVMQSREGYNESEWNNVPVGEIVPVKIGGMDGEFVQGMFVVYPGDASATWNSDAAVLRLRWVNNGVWYEIAKFGDVQGTEYLDREEMIRLAESLVISP